MLNDRSLPDGYRIREVEGRLYLVDPTGIPLHGPMDPFLIETYAWRHAWRRLERELNKELEELHAGCPLHRLRRLRQYMRMLDAAAQIPREVPQRPARRITAPRTVFAALAAAAAVILLILPLRTARVSNDTPHPAASSRPATMLLAKHPASVLPAQPSAAGTVRVAHTPHTWRHRPMLSKYAVAFGEFVNRTTADTMMHLIRSKGYIVHVARVGENFWVVTGPYRARAQVERLVGALQAIGLPAQLATALQSEALSD